VWRLLTRPGLIQIHFDDLCALVRDRHSESAFASVEASGPARSREVVEKLLAHPLLDEGHALAESNAVLVSLVGGKDLTMADVNRVMEKISRHCEQAQIIMGAAVDETLKNRLFVTVIAAKENIVSTRVPMALRPKNRRNRKMVRAVSAFVRRTTLSSHHHDDGATPTIAVRATSWPVAKSQLQDASDTIAVGDYFQGAV